MSTTEWLVAEDSAMRAENRRLRKVVADLEALCDADDAASLRPAHPDFEPIEVPWTVAVRAILAGA